MFLKSNTKSRSRPVFVQGGSFVMGIKEEDVMGDWNNVPRKVTVPSFFIDRNRK